MANFIVGAITFLIIGFSAYSVYKKSKSGACSGCSGCDAKASNESQGCCK